MVMMSAREYAKQPAQKAAEAAANAYSQSQRPAMPQAAPVSRSGGSTPGISQSYSPPPTPAAAKVNMPATGAGMSGLGSMYKNVPGTDWYATNDNPNASKYRADGSPVATVGYDNQQTGQSYHGYATPEQFQQINGASGNAAGASGLISGMISSGQLNMPQSSIYKPSGGYANMPMSSSQAAASSVNYPGMTSSATVTPTKQSGSLVSGYVKNPTVDSWDIDRQLAYYKVKPQEAMQEIARAESVGGPAAMKWTDQLRSAISQSSLGKTGQGSSEFVDPRAYNEGSIVEKTPNDGSITGSDLYKDPYARTPESIAALAKSRMDSILQAGRTSAQGALAGAKNAYDYTNQIEADNRTLRNAAFKEDNNPFSGKFAYDKTNMLRNDSIQDTAQDRDYYANVAQINQKLADLEAAAPGQEQQIIDDLQQIERTTGINVAQLQEQQKQNQFNNARQTKTDNWNAYMESVGLTGNLGTGAKADWGLLGGTDGEWTIDAKIKFVQQEGIKINTELAKLQLADYPAEQKLKMQQLQKQIDQIGKAPYQSAVDVEYDKIKLDTAKEQLKQLTNGKPAAGLKESDIADLIDKSPYMQKQYDDDGKVIGTKVDPAQKEALAQYIASLGLPPEQAKQWFIRYGLWSPGK